MKRGYQYYANRVFEQAVYDPDVDEESMAEVVEYAEEIAIMLVLDPERLKNEVRSMAHNYAMEA